MVHETNLLFTTLGKNLNCAINVYGILMSFILNKHITIFTDNDMYHANVATLGNRSPMFTQLNIFVCNSIFNYCFHIDYVLLITLYIKTAYLSCYVGFL